MHTIIPRYTLPDGLTAAPDVSCITSFTSTTMENSYDLQKSLDVHASTRGKVGIIGVSFSASGGYKSAMSMMSSGKFKVILSSAHCHYYFTKLNKHQPPRFSQEVVDWIEKVNQTYRRTGQLDPKSLTSFVEYFGSHVTEEALYGARFTYKHKMMSEKHENSKSKEISMSLEAEANLGSLLSLGGGFGMTSKQKEKAKAFQEKVETTTISVGAPPPYNGDAMQWASTVKETPVPVKVSLLPIYSIFSDHFIATYNLDDRLVVKIRDGLQRSLGTYCLSLLSEGMDAQCFDKSLVTFQGRKISQNMDKEFRGCLSASCCIEECYRQAGCYMVSHTTGSDVCRMIRREKVDGIRVENDNQSDMFVLLSKARDHLVKISNCKYSHGQRAAYQLRKDVVRHDDITELQKSMSKICQTLCSLDDMCSSFAIDPYDVYEFNCVTYSAHVPSNIVNSSRTSFSIQLVSEQYRELVRDQTKRWSVKIPRIALGRASNKASVVKTDAEIGRASCRERV